MRQKPPSYYKGLEFYRTPNMGLVGTENTEKGTGSTYTNLTDAEAKSWAAAWVEGKVWRRS